MRAPIAAARFLLAMGRAPGDGARSAAVLPVGGERLRAWRYAADRPQATVLALHGMSLRGVDDPRMHAACTALAAAGCDVLAPELPDAARLRVGTADLFRAVGLLEHLAPGGPLGLFAASFSAALALGAAARAPRSVTAVCGIGACGDVSGTVRHLLTTPGADPYGRMVLFRTFAPEPLGWCPALVAAIDTWLADDSLRRAWPGSPAMRAALPPAERALFDDLLAGGARTEALAARVLTHAAPVLDVLDLKGDAARVSAQVTLLHGADDPVVPATESVRLGARLRNAHVCVTPLLTHGDTRLHMGALPQVARLHHALSEWFRGLGFAG